jgi:DNA-binding CsgD family transcriptional regulator
MTDDTDNLTGAFPPVLVAFLLMVVVGGLTDIALDRPKSWWSAHLLLEIGVVLASLGFAIVIYSRWRRSTAALQETRASLALTEQVLAERQAERDSWRRSAEAVLAGFGAAIDAQFGVWGLTKAERDVALLLLKGLGHKQVAAQLSRSERTVRQHAVEVYRKAGVQGRSELAAFFLQDVELPS